MELSEPTVGVCLENDPPDQRIVNIRLSLCFGEGAGLKRSKPMAEKTVFVIEDIDLFEVEITGTLRISPSRDKFSPKEFYAYEVRFDDGLNAVLAPREYAEFVYFYLNVGPYYVED